MSGPFLPPGPQFFPYALQTKLMQGMLFADLRRTRVDRQVQVAQTTSKIGSKMKFLIGVWLGFVTLLGAGSLPGSAGGLTPAQADGYLQWLHSLETAVTARLQTDLDEANLLYPFDLPAWDLEDPRPYRHLSISKAVTELEMRWNNRGNGQLNSTLMALANARNYVNLSEYDSALVWYGVASRLDTTGSFRLEIAREGLACAASADDSLAMAQMMTNTLGASRLAGRQDELVLAYRWLLTARDRTSLTHLAQKIDAHPDVLTPRLRFWHAYALSWLGRPQEALIQLKSLILTGGLSHGLTESQRAWVLTALADSHFLLGDEATARSLYRSLASSRVQVLKTWGKYQLANIDFVNTRYLRAGNGFLDVCEGVRYGSWQDHACAMVDIARELERIKAEGEPYGVANYYRP